MKKLLLCFFLVFTVSFNYASAKEENTKSEIKFTDEQKNEIKKIKNETKQKIEGLQEQIKTLKNEIENVRKESKSSIRELLTPEQKEIFDKKTDKKEEAKKRISDKKDKKDAKDMKNKKEPRDKKDKKKD